MNKKDLMKKVKTNKNNSSSVKIREAKGWEYDTPYNMVIIDCQENENGFLEVKVGIEVTNGDFVEKDFSFKTDGAGRRYLDDFLDKIVADSDEEVTTKDLIGREFTGQIKKNNEYENLMALEDYDSESDSDDEDEDDSEDEESDE